MSSKKSRSYFCLPPGPPALSVSEDFRSYSLLPTTHYPLPTPHSTFLSLPSLLTFHSSLLTPNHSLLPPHSSPPTPPPTPHSPLLTPHSSLLTPLTPHYPLLTTHSSLPTPHSSLTTHYPPRVRCCWNQRSERRASVASARLPLLHVWRAWAEGGGRVGLGWGSGV